LASVVAGLLADKRMSRAPYPLTRCAEGQLFHLLWQIGTQPAYHETEVVQSSHVDAEAAFEACAWAMVRWRRRACDEICGII
jgi:hypothetical protein